jgi:DNA polymerase-1
MQKETIYLVDATAYIYRAFFALRGPFATRSGFPTNAIYGYTRMINRVLKQYRADYMVFVFDAPVPSFREKIYKQYKANRPPAPDDFKKQQPYIRKITQAYNFPILEIPGYEADDVVATIAKVAEKRGLRVVIVTGDKDYMQIVSDNIELFDEIKDEFIRREAVKQKLGVYPEQVVDYLALVGDSIDNIPGVKGVGSKTAAQLLQAFGSLDGIYQNIERVSSAKVRENLIAHKEDAYLSKKLVTINQSVPMEVKIEGYRIKEPDYQLLRELFTELEFLSFLQEFESAGLITRKVISPERYTTITSRDRLDEVIRKVKEQRVVSIDIETTSPSPVSAEIVGISLCWDAGEACYIPISHKYLGVPEQLKMEVVLKALKPILEDREIKKYGQNIKYDAIVLKRYGVEVEGICFDCMLAGYILDPDGAPHNLEKIASKYLSHTKTPYAQVVGKEKVSFENVKIEKATAYACEDADLVFRLVPILEEELKKRGLYNLLIEIELPLVKVLAEIEINGVKIDTGYLKRLSAQLNSKLMELRKRAWDIAGESFNLDSPQQVSKILYEKIGLKPLKRTKTGYSTDVGVLEKLAKKHALPKIILEHRLLAKLKNTYIDSLPELINLQTGRIHTSYNQAVAATGRLTSSDPNLQNIPVKSEEGRQIREAFIADKGYYLMSADYSQIELRVLADVSGDENLQSAFKQDRDIHTQTASEVFGVLPEKVDYEMRRKAKAINFGIAYGLSPYGLSEELDISDSEARRYIQRYFERYPKVKKHIEKTLENARKAGFVETKFKRRRYIGNLSATSTILRDRAERIAINAPIQGTAADIIKIAMVKLFKRLKREGLDARIIMQVHDELVLEVAEKDLNRAERVVREEMQNAVKLSVPLKVEVSTGKNWAQTK